MRAPRPATRGASAPASARALAAPSPSRSPPPFSRALCSPRHFFRLRLKFFFLSLVAMAGTYMLQYVQ